MVLSLQAPNPVESAKLRVAAFLPPGWLSQGDSARRIGADIATVQYLIRTQKFA